MTSRAIAGLALVFFGMAAAQAARPVGDVISQETAQRFGLERTWATHVELDRARGRVAHVTLQAGLLLVQTDQATVHVLDAETRQTRWVGHVGRAGGVTSPPAANEKFVVSTNGGMLYLFDRETGKVLWSRKMTSVPSTGPAISDSRVYVPLVTGMISTYRLPSDKKDETPGEQKLKDNALNYAGKGIAYQPPIVTPASVLWGTDAGNIYSLTTDELLPVYRFKARDSVLAGLMHRGSYVFAASRDGYVYCLRDPNGTPRWQFSIGNPIVETPMATNDGVYVIPETGGIYKLAIDTGEELWSSPGVFRFVSASPTRLYTVDSAGRLLILDARSGARIGALATQNLPIKVFNRDNDRIYLLSTTGLVQCLREVALKEPAWHGVTPVDNATKAEGDETTEKPKGAKPEAADDGTDPFGGSDKMSDDGDDADAMEDEN
ncbi:MAG TPA: PQQ-binding-like beta-propeller repeat protein [Pirellulales bacterium]|nr:PQQ-binding-like beta-propeller repeat protein [Pirellulales bacterium]